MNTQSRVFKKLAEVEKVELSAQKVELALVDDFLKKESLWKEYAGIMGEYKKSKNDSIQMAKALKGGVKKDIVMALKFVDKIKESSKDLGVDVPKKVLSLEQDFNQAISNINRITK